MEQFLFKGHSPVQHASIPITASKSSTATRATCSTKWRRGSHAPERAPPWLTRIQALRHALPHALLLQPSARAPLSLAHSLPSLSVHSLAPSPGYARTPPWPAPGRAFEQLRPPPAATTSQAMARRSTWLTGALPLTAGAACACRTHLRCRLFFPVSLELVAWSRWPGRPLPRPRVCLGKLRPRRSPPTPLSGRPNRPPAGPLASSVSTATRDLTREEKQVQGVFCRTIDSNE